MTRYTKYTFHIALLVLLCVGCKKKDYTMGALIAPSDIVISTSIVGQSSSMPDGDGSGNVVIKITGNNALSYKIDYDAADGISLQHLPSGTVTRKYTRVGVHTYRITVVAYGTGAAATTVTKDIQVRSDFNPDPALVDNLVGSGTKTWSVDKDVQGHFGVGPWSVTSLTPEWWSAPPNDKAGCCNCFYTTTFTFTRVMPANTFTLTVVSPDGAFTKTGALAGGLPGIPASGGEACYAYNGGTSPFSFVPSGSGIPASAPSTQTAIQLGGNNTFIGYGALAKEYEIISITATTLKLRVQGTETGNAWYLILKAN